LIIISKTFFADFQLPMMCDWSYKCSGYQYGTYSLLCKYWFQRSTQVKLIQKTLSIESMSSTKVACLLVVFVFVGTSKTENAETFEGKCLECLFQASKKWKR